MCVFQSYVILSAVLHPPKQSAASEIMQHARYSPSLFLQATNNSIINGKKNLKNPGSLIFLVPSV